MPTAPTTPSPNLTIEAIVAVEAPREFRLHPRERIVAYTAEGGGARQLFTLSLRGGYPIQLTASEKPVSDPQWSPDGRRIAFVRDDEVWVLEVDGSRVTLRRGKARGWPRPALVARRPSPRVPVAPAWLDPGLGHRRARPAPRPAGDRTEAAAPGRPDRDRAGYRSVRVGARRVAARRDGPPRAGRRRDRRRSRWSTSPMGPCESSPASAASTSERAGPATARCSSCPMRTAGSRSSD